MRNWSLPAGRLFGAELRIHWTFLVLLLFVVFTSYSPQHPEVVGRSLALVALVFGSVLLHEVGHTMVASRNGVPAKAIILLPIGGVSLLDETKLTFQPGTQTWKRDIRIALAGPVLNLMAALVAAGILLAVVPNIHLWQKPYVFTGNLPRSLVWCNAWLALFNLLPAYPMDGGRVLRALFSRRMDPASATHRAVSIGQAFALVFMLTGMLTNAWLTLIGVFLFISAQLEERSAVFQSVLEAVHLEDVMLTDFATLSPADTLEDALDKAVHTLQDDFPVIRGGDMVGVISKQRILQALRSEGNGYVQSAMNRIFDVAQKKESLASAFRKLSSRNLSLIPVVEDQRLVGIVTLQNLMHSMALLAESRKLRRS